MQKQNRTINEFPDLLGGDKKYHIVWETLNSKETPYIWHFEKSMDALRKGLTEIEIILTKIKITGKQDS